MATLSAHMGELDSFRIGWTGHGPHPEEQEAESCQSGGEYVESKEHQRGLYGNRSGNPRDSEHSHGGATGFTPPPGVTVHQIPPEQNIGSMLLAGELDATLLYLPSNNLIDRSRIVLEGHPDIEPLFRDREAEGLRYYNKTGMFPINHGMVIRREIAEAHPWVVLNIYKAFVEANELANQQRLEHVELFRAAGLLSNDAVEMLKQPLLEHGIAANRKTLETAAEYSLEQGLTPRLVALDEVFAASTMEQ